MDNKLLQKESFGIPKTPIDANTVFYASLDGTTTPEYVYKSGNWDNPLNYQNQPMNLGTGTFKAMPTGSGYKFGSSGTLSQKVPLTGSNSIAGTVDILVNVTDLLSASSNSTLWCLLDAGGYLSLQLLYTSSNKSLVLFGSKTNGQASDEIYHTTSISTYSGIAHIRTRWVLGDKAYIDINGVTASSAPYINAVVSPVQILLGAGRYTSTTDTYVSVNHTLSDIHISNIDRGSTFKTLPPDYISGNLRLRNRTQSLVRSDAQTTDTITKSVSPALAVTMRPDAVNKAYSGGQAANYTPTTLPSELPSYTDIQIKDATTKNATGTIAGNYSQQVYSFSLPSVNVNAASLSKLKFAWAGRVKGDYSGAENYNVNIYIWNNTLSAWDIWGGGETSGTEIIPMESSIMTANFTKYVDANGKVWVLVKPKYPASATIQSELYTDVAALQVECDKWSTGRTVKLESNEGIVMGVVDADTAVAKVVYAVNSVATVTVDDVSKLVVGDIVRIYKPTEEIIGSANITAIDTTTKTITLSNAYAWGYAMNGGFLIKITDSTSSPTVTSTSGSQVGTWSGLGNSTATYTITTPPATPTDNLTISYGVAYATGNGLSQLPTAIKDVVNSEAGVEIKGRTLVNLLGKDGNFEVDSNADGVADGWGNGAGCTTSLVVGKYGALAQKIINAAADSTIDRYLYCIKHPSSVSDGKYYVYLIDVVDINNATASIKAYYGTTLLLKSATTTAKGTLYTKFQQTGTAYSALRLRNESPLATDGYVTFDGARLYEIDAVTYNKIDVDPEYTGERLAAKFPYVDSVQFKTNTMVTATGKNLFDKNGSLLDQPSGSGFATTTYDPVNDLIVTLGFSGHYYGLGQRINLNPNKIYSYSFSAVGQDHRIVVLTQSGEILADKRVVAGSSGSFAFNSKSNTEWYIVPLTISTGGLYGIQNLQLELGSTATTFEPCTKTYGHTSIPLATDESVWLLSQGQSVYKKVWEKGVALTGDKTYTFASDYAGAKRISTPVMTGHVGQSATGYVYITKYNGVTLTDAAGSGNITTGDQHGTNGSDLKSYIGLFDSDTGWLDAMTPTSDEIKSYFYGWKMCASDGSTYVSGTKYWKKITDGTGITATLPTASYAGYTPYTLHYKLATPQYYIGDYNGSPIASAGSDLRLPEGIAQVEQRTGVCFQQKNILTASSGNYYLNHSSNPLIYRNTTNAKVYRNGSLDTTWTKPSANNGNYYCTSANYDPSGVYTTSYEQLDKYLYTVDTLSISNPTVVNAYSYCDQVNPDHSVGYFSFTPIFSSNLEKKEIAIAGSEIKGFSCYYEFNPYAGSTAAPSTVLAYSPSLIVTTAGSGAAANVSNRKSISSYLPAPTGFYDYQLYQDKVQTETFESSYATNNYKMLPIIGWKDNTRTDAETETSTLDVAYAQDLAKAIPTLVANSALVRDTNGEIKLRVTSNYKADGQVVSGTTTADYQIPGRPLLK